MRIADILGKEQVSVAGEGGNLIRNKRDAIRRLSELLAVGADEVSPPEIEKVLTERENLQSTGVGGGVAIPHGAIPTLNRIHGALLLCPELIAFDAIDGAPVGIFFAVIGPKKSTGEHLKTLARVSRLLRDESFRHELLHAESGAAAHALITSEELRLVGT